MTKAPHLAIKALPRGWREADHPRDRLGKWIETGAEVRLWGGIGGTVVGNLGGGRIEIERADGTHVSVHRNYLTVVKGPDGAEPSRLISANPTSLPERSADGDVEAIDPPDGKTEGFERHQTDSVVSMLSRIDDGTAQYLATAIRRDATAYLTALNNDTPGDEADSRASLLSSLDAAEANFGDRRGMREAINVLREPAQADIPDQEDPDGRDGSAGREALPDAPAGGVRRDQEPGDALRGVGGVGAGADRPAGGRPDAAGDAGGDVRADPSPAADRGDAGEAPGVPGDAAPDAGAEAGAGDAGGPGDGRSDDRVRAPAGDAGAVVDSPTAPYPVGTAVEVRVTDFSEDGFAAGLPQVWRRGKVTRTVTDSESGLTDTAVEALDPDHGPLPVQRVGPRRGNTDIRPDVFTPVTADSVDETRPDAPRAVRRDVIDNFLRSQGLDSMVGGDIVERPRSSTPEVAVVKVSATVHGIRFSRYFALDVEDNSVLAMTSGSPEGAKEDGIRGLARKRDTSGPAPRPSREEIDAARAIRTAREQAATDDAAADVQSWRDLQVGDRFEYGGTVFRAVQSGVGSDSPWRGDDIIAITPRGAVRAIRPAAGSRPKIVQRAGEAAPAAPTRTRLQRVTTDEGLGHVSPSGNLIAIRGVRGYTVYRRNDDPTSTGHAFSFGGARYAEAGSTATLEEYRLDWVGGDNDHVDDTATNPDVAASIEQDRVDTAALNDVPDQPAMATADPEDQWTAHERPRGGFEVRNADGDRVGAIFEQGGTFVGRLDEGDVEVRDRDSQAVLDGLRGAGAPSPAPEPETVEQDEPAEEPAEPVVDAPTGSSASDVATAFDSALADAEGDDRLALQAGQEAWRNGDEQGAARALDDLSRTPGNAALVEAFRNEKPADAYDPYRDALVPQEQVVWRPYESSDQVDDYEGPDEPTMRQVAGKRVRVRFYNDDGVAADAPEVGRFLDDGDGDWEWEAEGAGYAYPIELSDVHSVVRVSDPIDEGQRGLFDDPEPTDEQHAADLALLRGLLGVEDPAASTEPTRQRVWPKMKRRRGTIYTTNGGETTGWLNSTGHTYSIDVERDDGSYLSVPSWRVDSVSLDPEPIVDMGAVTRDSDVPDQVASTPLDGDVLDDDSPDEDPVVDVDVQPTLNTAEAVAIDRIPTASQRFVPPSDDNMAPAGEMAKVDANIAVLMTLSTLRSEGRAATPEEQQTLSRWAGWGGAQGIFDTSDTRFDRPGPGTMDVTRREALYALLTPSEILEARRNTLNAHYTDPRVVSAVWDAVSGLGFDGGRVLEPGSGSGTFIGLAPEGTDMVGVELDSTTAAISRYLYPDAQVRNESFADTKVPDESFDAAVGNVPFGRFSLVDRDHNPTGESIHNHFIIKSLALTRPGGIVAMLSSRHTLDSKGSRAREKMYEQADLIGAVRLPNGSHQRASGTDVIEDILIFRKRPEGAEKGDGAWVNASKTQIEGYDEAPIAYSDYFTAHPEHVLGDVTAEGGRFGSGEIKVTGDVDMPTLRETLDGIVAAAREDGNVATPRDIDRPALPDIIDADSTRHEGHIEVNDDGTVTQAVGGAAVPFDAPSTQIEELRGLTGLRDTLGALLTAEASTAEDTEEIGSLRARLNSQYDAYVAAYGPVNRFKYTKSGARQRPAQGGFRKDPLSASVRALEKYDASTGEATKASVFEERSVAPRTPRTSADNPADALALSMETYGEVNLPAIADLLGVDQPTAREQMRGYIFEDPALTETQQFEVEQFIRARMVNPDARPDFDVDDLIASTTTRLVPAAEYQSGHVRRKHAIAALMAESDPRYTENVEALAQVLPRELGSTEVDGRLGAPWIDAATVKEFVAELLGDYGGRSTKVSTSGAGIWIVVGDRKGTRSTEMWGTPEKPAPEIIQGLLEQRVITSVTVDGEKNLDATIRAQAKAEEIQERFSEWLWEQPRRAERLLAKYNYDFNGIALRTYDGSQRAFPGMSEEFNPHPHVRDAVERIVNEPTAMLAHAVGAGKTAEMVMGTQELRRMGLARKPAIVVPDHMLEQFTREYLEIYPDAKLLAAGSADLRGDGRREFVARAATGDWDTVILTQGAFNLIPMGKEQQQAYMDRELAYMRQALEDANAAAGKDSADKRTVKKMESELIRAETAMKKKLDKVTDVGLTFEQTGIDYLMVDEAHMYANLRVPSRVEGAGIPGSTKASDLHMKIEYLRANTKSGRVATFATGTPIRNTITQAYVMQRYLRPDLLEEAGVHNFDQWAASFGTVVSEMELKPEGEGYRQKVRFAKFRNVPEMLRMFHTFTDVKLSEDLTFLNRPTVTGGGPVTVAVPRSDAQAAFIAELGERADAVRSGSVEPEEDNMLKISTDGRKAALSMALIPDGEYEDDSKIQAAASQIYDIYADNRERVYTNPKTGEPFERPGAGQMVFLDMGTPKGTKEKDDEATVDDNLTNWNGYDALKAELVAKGMEPSSIRYIHEAKNDAQKDELFSGLKNGSIAVLVGSSDKMGVGTNAQQRLVALHHIDAPWRPADVEQRDGRGIRHGNLNKEIGIYRYVTEGSFDAYMWQTLERKAKFINQIMRGSLDVREIEDVGDTAMSYAEVKALATGNPDLLDKAKIDTVVQRLSRLSRGHARAQTNLAFQIRQETDRAQVLTNRAKALTEAMERGTDNSGENWSMTIGHREYRADDDITRMRERFAAMHQGDEYESDNPRMIAAETLRRTLLRFRDQQRYAYRETDIGTIGGYTITAKPDYSSNGEYMTRMALRDVPGSERSIDLSDLREGREQYLLRMLEGPIQRMEADRDRDLDRARVAMDEVAAMQSRLGLTFDQDAMLVAASAKADRLAAKIQRDSDRKEGKDVPFDPTIDTDQYDSPLVGGGGATLTPEERFVLDTPPEPIGPKRIAADDVRQGNVVLFDADEATRNVPGEVVSIGPASQDGWLMVTFRTETGRTYTRAIEGTSSMVKIGDTLADLTEQKEAPMLERRLAIVDGKVVVTVEAKAFGRRGTFRETDHPRDRQGRFIETGAEVRVWGGGGGKIVGMAGGGRVTIERSDGSRTNVDAGNVTVVKNPLGEAVSAPKPETDQVEPADAPDAAAKPPTQPRTAREAARGARPAARTTPAPQATPDNAYAVFEGPDGSRAWVDNEDGTAVGYTQDDPDSPDTILRYDDTNEWAQEVDDAGMEETDSPQEFGGSDDGTPASAVAEAGMANDDAAAAETPEAGAEAPAAPEDAAADGQDPIGNVPAANPDDTTISAMDEQQITDSLRSGPAADQQKVLIEELTRRAEERAVDIISKVTKAEPAVTRALVAIAEKFGGRMEGLQHRIKTRESLSRKIRDKSLLKGVPQEKTAAGMKDALRYTMILEPDDYTGAANEALDGFVEQGFEVLEADNTWGDGAVYQGINAVLRDPSGQVFELQFHTPGSFETKGKTHEDYEISRDPAVPLAERQAAHDRMVALQDKNPRPPGVEKVGDRVAGVQRPEEDPAPTPPKAPEPDKPDPEDE